MNSYVEALERVRQSQKTVIELQDEIIKGLERQIKALETQNAYLIKQLEDIDI